MESNSINSSIKWQRTETEVRENSLWGSWSFQLISFSTLTSASYLRAAGDKAKLRPLLESPIPYTTTIITTVTLRESWIIFIVFNVLHFIVKVSVKWNPTCLRYCISLLWLDDIQEFKKKNLPTQLCMYQFYSYFINYKNVSTIFTTKNWHSSHLQSLPR